MAEVPSRSTVVTFLWLLEEKLEKFYYLNFLSQKKKIYVKATHSLPCLESKYPESSKPRG